MPTTNPKTHRDAGTRANTRNQGSTRRIKQAGSFLALCALASCAQGIVPTVQVLPPAGKPFAAFQADQHDCSILAGNQVRPMMDRAAYAGLGTAVVGTALGAGLGAAIGGGRGAGIGAAAGAIGGTGVAADQGATDDAKDPGVLRQHLRRLHVLARGPRAGAADGRGHRAGDRPAGALRGPAKPVRRSSRPRTPSRLRTRRQPSEHGARPPRDREDGRTDGHAPCAIRQAGMGDGAGADAVRMRPFGGGEDTRSPEGQVPGRPAAVLRAVGRHRRHPCEPAVRRNAVLPQHRARPRRRATCSSSTPPRPPTRCRSWWACSPSRAC